MKKPHPFHVLSKKRCIDCTRFLKANVVERKPTADRCYRCFLKYEYHRKFIEGKRSGR